VWLDSLNSGEKITECAINNTGGWRTFQTFASVVKPVSGRHDVYLKFAGAETGKLFQLQWLYFTAKSDTSTSVPEQLDLAIPEKYGLEQNFPNPFNPTTQIEYSVAKKGCVSLKVYNLLGQELMTLFDDVLQAGNYVATFDGRELAGGVYLYQLNSNSFKATKKLMLLK
jgi:hypothetical protein